MFFGNLDAGRSCHGFRPQTTTLPSPRFATKQCPPSRYSSPHVVIHFRLLPSISHTKVLQKSQSHSYTTHSSSRPVCYILRPQLVPTTPNSRVTPDQLDPPNCQRETRIHWNFWRTQSDRTTGVLFHGACFRIKRLQPPSGPHPSSTLEIRR